jgi:hypothetical protein
MYLLYLFFKRPLAPFKFFEAILSLNSIYKYCEMLWQLGGEHSPQKWYELGFKQKPAVDV